MSFQCDTCNKFYKNKKSLWQHNKNIHINKKILNKQNKSKEHICQFCNKSFSHKGNLIRHHKVCKTKADELVINKEEDSGMNKETFQMLKQAMNEQTNFSKMLITFMTENFSKIQPQNTDSISAGNENTINNNVNKSNNSTINKDNTVNNNIIISLGNENIKDTLTSQEKIGILKQKNRALESMIETVHFNNKYPQFHNVVIQDDSGYIYDDKLDKFISISKEDLLFDLIENRANDLIEINQENKIKIPKKTYDIVNSYINMLEIKSRLNNQLEKIEPIVDLGSQLLIQNSKIKLRK
jgi:hypothetical protein